MFLFYGNLSDKISLIKWTNRCSKCCLEVTRLTHCDWSIRRQKASLAYVIKSYITYNSPVLSRFFPCALNLARLFDAAASRLRSAASLAISISIIIILFRNVTLIVTHVNVVAQDYVKNFVFDRQELASLWNSHMIIKNFLIMF